MSKQPGIAQLVGATSALASLRHGSRPLEPSANPASIWPTDGIRTFRFASPEVDEDEIGEEEHGEVEKLERDEEPQEVVEEQAAAEPDQEHGPVPIETQIEQQDAQEQTPSIPEDSIDEPTFEWEHHEPIIQQPEQPSIKEPKEPIHQQDEFLAPTEIENLALLAEVSAQQPPSESFAPDALSSELSQVSDLDSDSEEDEDEWLPSAAQSQKTGSQNKKASRPSKKLSIALPIPKKVSEIDTNTREKQVSEADLLHSNQGATIGGVTLEQHEVWESFAREVNEVIVNKPGR